MKRIMIAIMAGLLIGSSPIDVLAKRYKKTPLVTPIYPQMPSAHPITISVDEETGEVTMCFSYAIEDLTISLKQNGVTLDSFDTSVDQGETVLYELEDYDAGDYTLVLETADGVIKTYYITIED